MKFLLSMWSIFSVSCFADTKLADETGEILSPENEPYYNLLVGVSPFTGILGFEYQQENHAIGLGLPDRITYRYYFKPYQDTKFWGVYLGGHSLNSSDTNKTYSLHGVNYNEVERSYIGAGIGYRWQWPSAWNVNASIAIEYFDDKYSNAATLENDTDSGIFLFPGINIGYKF